MILLLFLWALPPLITYGLYWYWSQQERKEEQAPPPSFIRDLCYGFITSLATFPLLVLAYPLGWLPIWDSKPKAVPKGTVLFIHGFFHNRSAALMFRCLLPRRGYSFATLSYSSWRSDPERLVTRLEHELMKKLSEIDYKKPLFIVGHSLGGLLAALLGVRLQRHGLTPQSVITLGAPFQGSKLANFGTAPLTKFLRYGSEGLLKIYRIIQFPPFKGFQLWSPADNMVLPLGSLYNVPEGWAHKPTLPVSHGSMLIIPGICKQVIEIIDQERTGKNGKP